MKESVTEMGILRCRPAFSVSPSASPAKLTGGGSSPSMPTKMLHVTIPTSSWYVHQIALLVPNKASSASARRSMSCIHRPNCHPADSCSLPYHPLHSVFGALTLCACAQDVYDATRQMTA